MGKHNVVLVKNSKRENFDYTEWRKKYFDNFQQGKFHEEAVAYAKANPHTGKGKRL